MFDVMPTSAIENVRVDFVGGFDAMASELVRRARLLVAGQYACTCPARSAECTLRCRSGVLRDPPTPKDNNPH